LALGAWFGLWVSSKKKIIGTGVKIQDK
jgi:hypothetical protein